MASAAVFHTEQMASSGRRVEHGSSYMHQTYALHQQLPPQSRQAGGVVARSLSASPAPSMTIADSLSASPLASAATESSQSGQRRYICSLCEGCKPTKRSNIEQHIWQKHAEQHGGNSYLHRYRASDHKRLVARFVKEVADPNTTSLNPSHMTTIMSPEMTMGANDAIFPARGYASAPMTHAFSSQSLQHEMEQLDMHADSYTATRARRISTEGDSAPCAASEAAPMLLRRLLSATPAGPAFEHLVASPMPSNASSAYQQKAPGSDAVLNALAELIKRGDLELRVSERLTNQGAPIDPLVRQDSQSPSGPLQFLRKESNMVHRSLPSSPRPMTSSHPYSRLSSRLTGEQQAQHLQRQDSAIWRPFS